MTTIPPELNMSDALHQPSSKFSTSLTKEVIHQFSFLITATSAFIVGWGVNSAVQPSLKSGKHKWLYAFFMFVLALILIVVTSLLDRNYGYLDTISPLDYDLKSKAGFGKSNRT